MLPGDSIKSLSHLQSHAPVGIELNDYIQSKASVGRVYFRHSPLSEFLSAITLSLCLALLVTGELITLPRLFGYINIFNSSYSAAAVQINNLKSQLKSVHSMSFETIYTTGDHTIGKFFFFQQMNNKNYNSWSETNPTFKQQRG